MFRLLAALTVTFALSMPAFAHGPSTTIWNQGSGNFNKVVNTGGPLVNYPHYPGYPHGASTSITNVGNGNVNIVKNIGLAGAGAHNQIVNVGNGNVNKIINR